jgi:hypothetical protein
VNLTDRFDDAFGSPQIFHGAAQSSDSIYPSVARIDFLIDQLVIGTRWPMSRASAKE